MPTAKPTAPRKRNRKRKRRLASSSSSSDSDSSSDEAEVSKKTPVKKATPIKPHATASPAEESSPSPSSSSPSSSDSEEGDDVPHAPVTHPAPSSAIPQRLDSEPAKTRERPRSPSPSPPPADAPPFLPPEGSSSRAQDEQALRNRFRQFWMASVADAFADDLEQIRQEPNMTKSRLAILIDSLASGGEVFSSYAGENGGLNEVDVVLNSSRDV